MIIFSIIGIVVVVWLVFDWINRGSSSSLSNKMVTSIEDISSESNTTKNTNGTNISTANFTSLVKQAQQQKKCIEISNLTPFVFKQFGEEKLSDLPQSISIDFSSGLVNLSSTIALVVACDTIVKINSVEKMNDADVINLSPTNYEFSICAALMYSDEKIVVVDMEFGMFVSFEHKNQWIINIYDSFEEHNDNSALNQSARKRIEDIMNKKSRE